MHPGLSASALVLLLVLLLVLEWVLEFLYWWGHRD